MSLGKPTIACRRSAALQHHRRLALDEPLAVYGGEAIHLDGRVVGRATSGNTGYTVEKSLVLGYLPTELLSTNRFEVEAFGRRTAATLIKGAAYDPERRKILC